jgi:histidine triad (HIT) family protein
VRTDFNHEPDEYQCPFCLTVRGQDADGDYTKQSDVVHRDNTVTAFVSPAWWPANAGHVLVVPNDHHENIYDIPEAVLASVQIMGKRIALALRTTYGCSGTSFRQHNEPVGGQEVWHYHLHVFPRYPGDDLYGRYQERRWTTPLEREPYVKRLRDYLVQW